MKIIVGLGNPGKKYEKTRHNVGFMMVDKLHREWDFPEFKFNKKIDTEISVGKISVSSRAEQSGVEGSCKNIISEEKILLAKPMTFMNNSGEVVKKIMRFYKLKPADLVVIHDDLDIELGKYKIAVDSSSAGHQGVQNIIDQIGTQKFKRIRIGIEGEKRRKNRLMLSDEFVLKNFTSAEQEIIQNNFDEIIYFLPNILN